ncbi:hypothetical protein CEUSTIGMA_g9696.t1 [Chlamydomonas eustigma]|uniref:Reverse transcriptase Ty1/copia-type domain-containing protein n=1 Tax=Chlamydomonas eustigma TaxID=1157962 RepID=A0A250XGR7_9CHLO|nr:hypothetical protein CEUSTIGMA_g9696.t1 [Chlamydomonas eustigma]|eukprot:GAX82268.1 hypothetical protein CEUSTIGMA_g9696.t1 [Chlamydomonas eustigma]
MYGLKQASRAWYDKLKDMMTSFGWTASDANPAFSGGRQEQLELKQQLGNMVEIKDLGVASYYLAMEVQQRSDKLLLTQQKYISEILERFLVP